MLQLSGANLHKAAPWGGSESLGDVLLEPTVIYVKRLLALIDAVDVKVWCHSQMQVMIASTAMLM